MKEDITVTMPMREYEKLKKYSRLYSEVVEKINRMKDEKVVIYLLGSRLPLNMFDEE